MLGRRAKGTADERELRAEDDGEGKNGRWGGEWKGGDGGGGWMEGRGRQRGADGREGAAVDGEKARI